MARTLPFTKGHGTGNDFVIVADPDSTLDLSDDQVAALCDRHVGIGGDGILRVVRATAIPEGAAAAVAGVEWFMDYRNADGSAAEMCGNGIRVFARYLADSGLADLSMGALPIGTRAGVKTVTVHPRGFEVDLGTFTLPDVEVLVRAKGLPVARPGQSVDVGNPHIVVAVASDSELDGLDLAYQPVLDPAPPAGANVEFVVPREPLVHNGVGAVRMRVFERGVGETLSCGTGVAATALAVRSWAGEGAPDDWEVTVPDGVLGVRVGPAATGMSTEQRVFLSGPAMLVFTGTIVLA